MLNNGFRHPLALGGQGNSPFGMQAQSNRMQPQPAIQPPMQSPAQPIQPPPSRGLGMWNGSMSVGNKPQPQGMQQFQQNQQQQQPSRPTPPPMPQQAVGPQNQQNQQSQPWNPRMALWQQMPQQVAIDPKATDFSAQQPEQGLPPGGLSSFMQQFQQNQQNQQQQPQGSPPPPQPLLGGNFSQQTNENYGFARGGPVQEAKGLASLGRNGDKMLVHMTPREVAGLQQLAMAHGGSLTRNPHTGLIEASWLESLIPMIGGGLLAMTGIGAPAAAGIMAAEEGIRKKDWKAGLLGGLGAFGGAGLASSLGAAGGAAAGAAADAGTSAASDAATQAATTGAGAGATDSAMQGIGNIASNPLAAAGAPASSSAAGTFGLSAAQPTAAMGDISNSFDLASNQIGLNASSALPSAATSAADTANAGLKAAYAQNMAGNGGSFGTQMSNIGQGIKGLMTKQGLADVGVNTGKMQLAMAGAPIMANAMNPSTATIPPAAPHQYYVGANGKPLYSPGTINPNIARLGYLPAGQAAFQGQGWNPGQFTTDPTQIGMAGGGAVTPPDPQRAAMMDYYKSLMTTPGIGTNMPAPPPPDAMNAYLQKTSDMIRAPTPAPAPTAQPAAPAPVASGGGGAGDPSSGPSALPQNISDYFSSQYDNPYGYGYATGGLTQGPGDGMSDSLPATINGAQPARLADGEFVVPADVVSHLGNGSTSAGAKHLYDMMERVRRARTGNSAQGKQINASKYLA